MTAKESCKWCSLTDERVAAMTEQEADAQCLEGNTDDICLNHLFAYLSVRKAAGLIGKALVLAMRKLDAQAQQVRQEVETVCKLGSSVLHVEGVGYIFVIHDASEDPLVVLKEPGAQVGGPFQTMDAAKRAGSTALTSIMEHLNAEGIQAHRIAGKG